MRESSSDPKEPELSRGPEATGEKLGRAAARRGAPGGRDTRARGKPYTEKPQFGEAGQIQSGHRPKPRSRWIMVALVAATFAVGGLIWKQDALPHWTHPWSSIEQQHTLTLTAADIDYAATAAARESLARGEIPPILAHADAETRRKILSGEENLYTKRLLDENQQRGIIVHARVSTGGVFLGEDLLTTERPQGTTFPAGSGAPAHFHFTVEQAGPNGVVSCYVKSANGAAVSTRPMAAGESGDLEVVTP